MTKIKIVDIESSGLKSYPRDIALQIGITEIDTEEKTVVPIFDKVLGYNIADWKQDWKKAWIFDNSDLRLVDIKKAFVKGDTAEKVGTDAHNILVGQKVAIYNVAFDYSNYLRKPPFNITRKNTTILPCLMVFCTDICRIPLDWGHGYKWPRLEESFGMLVRNSIKKKLYKSTNFHNASYDTEVAGWLLLELIKKYNYKVD